MKRLFFGGVHPADKKELSADSPLTTSLSPSRVSILMSQHIGVPCTPLVRVGDRVKKGQKIGDGEGLCVSVHASVSGKVIAIEPGKHPTGSMVTAVVIENDFQDTMDAALVPHAHYHDLGQDEIISIIRDAGIVGMGGATFSTGVKAAASLDKVDTLIANACECEPYITADDMLLRAYPKEVLEGIRIICGILKPEKVVIAVEENKKAAIEGLKKALGGEEKIQLRVLPTRYPQGAEKQLVKAVTGREIAPGQLPASAGCVVFNVATFAATYRAVVLGRPVTDRLVTVSGEAVNRPGNFYAPIGTSFEDMLLAAGGLKENACNLISGGPMMGFSQEDLSASIIKGTNAILGLSEDEAKAEPYVCIRCGKCIGVCPMHLQPLHLYRNAGIENREGLMQYNLTDCIECGCCSYECPSRLPLTASFKKAKQMMKEESPLLAKGSHFPSENKEESPLLAKGSHFPSENKEGR